MRWHLQVMLLTVHLGLCDVVGSNTVEDNVPVALEDRNLPEARACSKVDFRDTVDGK